MPAAPVPTDPDAAERGYRGPTVCKLVGITYRQLDYWARTNLVTPSVRAADGSGSQRLYGFQDLVELRIIKRLLDAGVSLQRIREAIAHLRAQTPGGSLTDLTLMSDGSRIYACHSGEEVIDVLAKGQAVFGIAVGRVIQDTEGDVAQLPTGALSVAAAADTGPTPAGAAARARGSGS